MSRITENKAKEYLIKKLNHATYEFSKRNLDEHGFDMWMKDKQLRQNIKVELKATEGKYGKRSDIFQKLYFSAENEVDNFKRGDTKIVRVFLGNNPPKVFILDKNILKHGANFKSEFRAKIVGRKNYDDIIEIK